MANNNSCNNFAPAQFIVNPTAGSGTHTTIGAAITAASSGQTIFIMPGTYTENPALKTGVNLTCYTGDGVQGTVIINGKCTYSSAGTVTISNIRLQTNSDFLLSVTGSSASVVNLIDCYLNMSNNTGIQYTSSSGSSSINVYRCGGNLGTTGIAIHTDSSAGSLTYIWTRIDNSGGSSTATSNSSSAVYANWCDFYCPFSTSSTGNLLFGYTQVNSAGTNTACVTTAGTNTANQFQFCNLASGSASCFSIGTGTSVFVRDIVVASSNSNVMTGAGTISASGITYTNGLVSGNLPNNVTTQSYNPRQGYSNLQLISTQTASSSASLTFTSGITTAFNNYVLVLSNYVPATNNTQLQLQWSTDGGSTYKTSGYLSGMTYTQYNSATTANVNGTAAVILNTAIANTAGYGQSGVYHLQQLTNGSYLPTSSGTFAGALSNTGLYVASSTSVYTTAVTVNALKILSSSGNLSTGTFSLFGVIQ